MYGEYRERFRQMSRVNTGLEQATGNFASESDVLTRKIRRPALWLGSLGTAGMADLIRQLEGPYLPGHGRESHCICRFQVDRPCGMQVGTAAGGKVAIAGEFAHVQMCA
ncbi:hypothetical protein WJX77_008527 [Trebouxia sp. C0004]